ncbi:helix-turn-helix domain-containing protein [Pararoseomonas sp. SCSIO 73927]|uniref:TetR/AcrR family transcriptional regulator n=1 Tax=Pararoseomonas sp. SCSIO 73927 TaxID=3114537 RepID=UPI0030D03103
MERPRIQEARLAVARHAAALFWKHGVEGTSGDAIAAAAGLSKRTVWRYFRSKEACVEPLFLATGYRFIETLRAWPGDVSIERHLHEAMTPAPEGGQEMEDGVAAARLVSLFPREPALRAAYLMASAQAEAELLPIVASRAGLPVDGFEVRLCAAAAMAALRVVDEEICSSAITHGRRYGLAEVIDRLAAAIRAACTLPICDPVRLPAPGGPGTARRGPSPA